MYGSQIVLPSYNTGDPFIQLCTTLANTDNSTDALAALNAEDTSALTAKMVEYIKFGEEMNEVNLKEQFSQFFNKTAIKSRQKMVLGILKKLQLALVYYTFSPGIVAPQDIDLQQKGLQEITDAVKAFQQEQTKQSVLSISKASKEKIAKLKSAVSSAEGKYATFLKKFDKMKVTWQQYISTEIARIRYSVLDETNIINLKIHSKQLPISFETLRERILKGPSVATENCITQLIQIYVLKRHPYHLY